MTYSSIMGAETAPVHPTGKESGLLGPGDNSDTGSDTVGTFEALADTDSVGTGERSSVSLDEQMREGNDIMPDRIVDLAGGEVTTDDDAPDLENLDPPDDGMTAEEQDEAKL
ncbi:MAG: hypothetical protein H7255_09925 [Ramlibacter sp.]|nr:hypothetical protein [Ramlibacter sp.]